MRGWSLVEAEVSAAAARRAKKNGGKKEERAKNFLCNSLKSASVCSLRVPRISFAELARNSGLSFFVGFIFFVFFFLVREQQLPLILFLFKIPRAFFGFQILGFWPKEPRVAGDEAWNLEFIE